MKTITPQKTLDNAIKKHLIIDDWQAVHVVEAMVAAHILEGTPMWLRIIGQSGSGKTRVMDCFSDSDFCKEIGFLTPASIRRGYTGDDESPQMLATLNGKLVLTKEFASLLCAKPDAKKEIFGMLRQVYDGKFVSDHGSKQGHLEQRCKFDWIVATTPYVYEQRNLDQQLGTRFIDLRWQSPNNKFALYDKAISNNTKHGEVTNELAFAGNKFIDSIKQQSGYEYELDESTIELVKRLSFMLAVLRAEIARDYKHEIITGEPADESGTRIAEFLARLAGGCQLIGLDYSSILARVALDSLPPLRRKVFKYYAETEAEKVVQKEIGSAINISQAKVSRELEDIRMILGNDEKNITRTINYFREASEILDRGDE